MKSKFLTWWKANWGLGIFLIDTLVSLAWVWRSVTGHYLTFSQAARHLWRLEDPYGIGYAGGAFFYSPGCGLYLYGPFAALPDLVGQGLFVILAFATFWIGLQKIFAVLKEHYQLDMQTSYYRHLFWLMAGSEAIGGIIAVKTELLLVGAILWGAANLLQNRRVEGTLFVLGFMTVWKLHPISLFGLILIVFVLEKNWRAPLAFGAGMATSFLSPLLVLPSVQFQAFQQHWVTSLQTYVSSDWLDRIYQHIFGFVARTFSMPISLDFANRVTAAAAVALATIVGLSFLVINKRKGPQAAHVNGLLIALGLGSGFMVVFSYLIQSNSYIIYIPLPLVVIAYATSLKWPKVPVACLLGVSYWIISLAYSDLDPRPLYHILYDWGVKPLGVLALMAALVLAVKRLCSTRGIGLVPREPL